MSGQMRLEFISKGFQQILESDGTRSAVESAGEAIQARANGNLEEESSGFSCSTWKGNYGGGRWVCSVTTTDNASIRAEAYDKALTRAVK